jgi:multidrug resistance efflux pump
MQEGQYLKAGIIGHVIPKSSLLYAEANLPQRNLGKIDTGLIVQLRLEAYPYQENGFIEGKIDYISDVYSNNGFLTTIKLTNGLVTNRGRKIPCKSGLNAQAVIITKNLRLADKLFSDFLRPISVSGK